MRPLSFRTDYPLEYQNVETSSVSRGVVVDWISPFSPCVSSVAFPVDSKPSIMSHGTSGQ